MNKVLETAQNLKKYLTEVSINEEGITSFIAGIKNPSFLPSVVPSFNTIWSRSELFKLCLIFNSMNFCYWAEKGKEKWTIKIDEETLDGSIAFIKLIERVALVEKLSSKNGEFLQWSKLASLSYGQFKNLFSGCNVEIPLQKERYQNLVSLSEIIVSRYDSNSDNMLNQCGNSAEKILETLSELEVFKDQSIFHGEWVYFYKRGQFIAKMFSDLSVSIGEEAIDDLDKLTGFADYKVPQLLRHLGIISYSNTLATKVDNYELIEKDSIFENEIRISTILAIELIREKLEALGSSISASEIDSILWNRAASNKDKMMPYHRTYTTAY